MNKIKQTLRKYGTFIAAGGMLIIGLIALATVWFLRQAEGPVAPNAPSSIPQAAGNVCSIQWGVQNECLSMNIKNADTGADIAPGSQVTIGTKLTISCEGLPGTNFWKYRYSLTGSAPWTLIAKGKITPSPVFDTATLNVRTQTNLSLRCRPFAGDWGARLATVDANCTKAITLVPSATPTPSPSPSPSPSVSPSPSPSPIACAAMSFTENFGSAIGPNERLRLWTTEGSGTVTVANGVATMSVVASRPPYDRLAGITTRSAISGDFETLVDINSFTTGGVGGMVRLGITDGNTMAFVGWVKSGTTSELSMAQSSQLSAPTSRSELSTNAAKVDLPANAQVTVKLVRTAGRVAVFYKTTNTQFTKLGDLPGLTGPAFVKVQTMSNDTTSTAEAVVDNFIVRCVSTPASCSNACNATSDCSEGLICSGGMCRNPSCTGEAGCVCPTASPSPSPSPSPSVSPSPTPASCSNTCSATSDCSAGLICSGGMCRNPSCTNQTSCVCPTSTPSPTPVSCSNGCSANSDCSSGLICSGGMCRNPSCTNESDCTCNTPTPTPLAGCSNSCVTSSDCNGGLTCSDGMCRNPSCTNQTNCVCQIAQATPTPVPGAPAPVVTPTPTPQQQLPQAGSTAQTVALLTLGIGVIGMGVLRFYAMKR